MPEHEKTLMERAMAGIDWDSLGDHGEAPAHMQFEPPADAAAPSEPRPSINPTAFLNSIRTLVGFKELSLGRRINVLGFGKTLPGGGYQSYEDRHEQERRSKGLAEAAFLGEGRLGKHPGVFFGTEWKFIAGSLSADGGARFQKAVDLAIKSRLPLIALYSSAGMRQQENGISVVQMRRMVHAVNRYNAEVNLPHIAVLIGNVYGGVSAGSTPLADVVIGIRGSDYGFTGPKVIEGYTGQAVPAGAQSVEEHAENSRLVDRLLTTPEDVVDYSRRLLDVTDPHHGKLSARNLMRDIKRGPDLANDPEALYQRYLEIRSGTRRSDTQFLIRNVFSDSVDLYTSQEEPNGVAKHPAIIAAIGKIGPQPFLIIGNQPSYYLVGDTLRKVPASPEPKDFIYARRMLAMGARLNLPVVLLTDTLGAKPTLESEHQGQGREIAETIRAVDSYPHPVISIITGGMGSGGGMAMTIGDRTLMLEEAQFFVADPVAATSILYSTSSPPTDQVRDTLRRMDATAHDQLRRGLIDEIVPEGKGKEDTAAFLRNSIVKAQIYLDGLSQRRLLSRRDRRIRVLGEPKRAPIRKRLHGRASDKPASLA